MPLVRPVHTAEVPVTVQSAPAGVEVTVYLVMVAPLLAPAVQFTVALEVVATSGDTALVGVVLTLTWVGADGAAEGVIAADAALASEVPAALVAVTVKV